MPDPILIAAMLLLGASLFAGRSGTGDYLRFAAMLSSALALAVLSRVEGLAAAAALVTLPLAGAALGLSALARVGRRSPPLLACLLLALALASGLSALFTGMAAAALLPLALGGLAMLLAAGRPVTMLSGLLLLAASSAGLGEGMGAGLLALLAAALTGAGLYRRVSSRTAFFVSAAP